MLVALRESRASYAVSPYFLGQARLVRIPEPQLLKKERLIGERKDPFNSESLCLAQASFDQLLPYPQLLVLPPDRQRPDFGEVFPQNVQGANSLDISFFFNNHEIPDIFVELVYGPWYHKFPACKFIDKFLNFFDIRNNGFSCFQDS